LTSFSPIEPLERDHDVTLFDCGSEAQSDWLRRHAYLAQQAGSARVFVVCLPETRTVVGYYALAAGSVTHAAAPQRMLKGLGRHPVPVVILTRLGIDRGSQGRGLGTALVQDAFMQTAATAERVGVRALLIHCETPAARDFYRGIDPAFEQSPTDPLHVVLLMKDLRAALGAAARALGDTPGG
jgi:hypothetical protein